MYHADELLSTEWQFIPDMIPYFRKQYFFNVPKTTVIMYLFNNIIHVKVVIYICNNVIHVKVVIIYSCKMKYVLWKTCVMFCMLNWAGSSSACRIFNYSIVYTYCFNHTPGRLQVSKVCQYVKMHEINVEIYTIVPLVFSLSCYG